MSLRDPRRILRIVHRTTAGSLVAAAVGSGVVAVHLAGDQAAAAATRVESAPRPLPQADRSASRGSASARTTTPAATTATKPSATAKATRTRHRHHVTSTSGSQGFAPVAPVQTGNGPAQSGSGGS